MKLVSRKWVSIIFFGSIAITFLGWQKQAFAQSDEQVNKLDSLRYTVQYAGTLQIYTRFLKKEKRKTHQIQLVVTCNSEGLQVTTFFDDRKLKSKLVGTCRLEDGKLSFDYYVKKNKKIRLSLQLQKIDRDSLYSRFQLSEPGVFAAATLYLRRTN